MNELQTSILAVLILVCVVNSWFIWALTRRLSRVEAKFAELRRSESTARLLHHVANRSPLATNEWGYPVLGDSPITVRWEDDK